MGLPIRWVVLEARVLTEGNKSGKDAAVADGAGEMITELREHGVKVALWTAARGKAFRMALQKGLGHAWHHVDAANFQEDSGGCKWSPGGARRKGWYKPPWGAEEWLKARRQEMLAVDYNSQMVEEWEQQNAIILASGEFRPSWVLGCVLERLGGGSHPGEEAGPFDEEKGEALPDVMGGGWAPPAKVEITERYPNLDPLKPFRDAKLGGIMDEGAHNAALQCQRLAKRNTEETLVLELNSLCDMRVGRYYAHCENWPSLANVKKHVRRIVANGQQEEVDIANSHPRKASFLAEGLEGLGCAGMAALHEYCARREEVLHGVMGEAGVSRDAAKGLFLKAMFGGLSGLAAWEHENQRRAPQRGRDFVQALEALKQNLRGWEPFERVRLRCQRREESEGRAADERALSNKALAQLLQTVEGKEEAELKWAIEEQGVTVRSFVHDSVIVDAGARIDLAAVQARVAGRTGFPIALERKPMAPREADWEWLEGLREWVTEPCHDHEACQRFLKWARGQGYTFYAVGASLLWGRQLLAWGNEAGSGLRRLISGCPTVGRAYGGFLQKNDKILQLIPEYAERWDAFLIDKVELNKHKLPLEGTILDMRTMEKLPYSGTGHAFTVGEVVGRDVADDAEREWALWHALVRILGDEAAVRFFLRALRRMVAKHIEDKRILVIIGDGNSGKGTLSYLIREALTVAQCGEMEVANLAEGAGRGDEALSQSWMVSYADKSVLVANEKPDGSGKKSRIEGKKLKKLASGGDVQQGRTNRKDERAFVLQASAIIFANDVLDIANFDDAVESRLVVLHMPNQFLEGENLEQAREMGKGNVYPKDSTVDDLFKERRSGEAFLAMALRGEPPGDRTALAGCSCCDGKPEAPAGSVAETSMQASRNSLDPALLEALEPEEGAELPISDIKGALAARGFNPSENKIVSTLSKLNFTVLRKKVANEANPSGNSQQRCIQSYRLAGM